MNYKCPFPNNEQNRLCDTQCRFFSIEPQISNSDPASPGSCIIAQYFRVALPKAADEDSAQNINVNLLRRIVSLLETMAKKFGISVN